jgi:hypothetical protein
MSHKQFDPLSLIPSSESIKRKLHETERLARRLRILLETAEKIETPAEPPAEPPPCGSESRVTHAGRDQA